ncbi:MAG: SfnB family sulfur acquisition oxidoreductase [Sphingomonadales bacterium]|nr:SfnB family sulfur acquisition oxidoreductase [Sphingomonadales bacterium]
MSNGLQQAALPVGKVALIRSDAEAIAVAKSLAHDLAKGAIARDRDPIVPFEELDALAASGLLAITIPTEHGGANVSIETVVEVFRILTAADSAIGQLPQNHFVFVEALKQDGDDEQRAFFFAEVLNGARFGNAQAERGSGSAVDLRTRLSASGDGYRLNGTKYYCTGAYTADWIPVAAIDDDDRAVIAFVRRDAPGVEASTDWDAMGQRVTFSGTVRFENVRVSGIHIVPHWRLFHRPNLYHSYGALLHASIEVGIARNALEDTAEALRGRTRPRFGAKVATALEDSLLLGQFGIMVVKLHALEALLAKTARIHDNAVAAGVTDENAAVAAVAVSAVKAFAEDVALEISSELFAFIGSASLDRKLGFDRHWRNARSHTVHDANQWRYLQVGDWLVNKTAPGKPVRKRVE